jgi:tRNA pseudouridine55 synthase
MKDSGYLLMYKKSGMSSFESLNAVKKAFAVGKVGHTGTLDKFATGLLLVLVGRAVKLTPWFSGGDKQYEGTIRFGVETDTLDPEGVPVAEGPMPSLDRLQQAMSRFKGDILQTPPAYSAIHIGGKRASARARSGETVDMPERLVSVYDLKLHRYQPPDAVISVYCSKGTYIRSLARDIARAAGSRAHLAALNRTHIAGFQASDAASDAEDAAILRQALKPLDIRAFRTLGLPCFTVSDETALMAIHGKPPPEILARSAVLSAATMRSVVLFRQSGEFLAVLEQKDGLWRYGYVYH